MSEIKANPVFEFDKDTKRQIGEMNTLIPKAINETFKENEQDVLKYQLFRDTASMQWKCINKFLNYGVTYKFPTHKVLSFGTVQDITMVVLGKYQQGTKYLSMKFEEL